MNSKSKTGMIFFSLSICIISYLSYMNYLNDSYWTSNTYMRIRSVVLGDSAHFILGNVPAHESFVIVVKKVAGVSPFELIQLPLAGISASIFVYVAIRRFSENETVAGLSTLLITITIARSPWTYGLKHVQFGLLYGIIFLSFLLIRNSFQDPDRRILAAIVGLIATANMFYYTAGGKLILFMFGVLLVLSYNEFVDTTSYNSGWVYGVLLINGIFFIFFTKVLYTAVPVMIGSLEASLNQITGILSIIGASGESTGPYVYAGSRFTDPDVARLRIYLTLVYILITASVVVLMIFHTLRKIRDKKPFNAVETIILGIFILIFGHTVTYLLIGTLLLASYFGFIPALTPIIIALVTKDRDWVSDFSIQHIQVGIMVVLIIVAAPLFALTVSHGGMNYVEPTEVQPPAKFVSDYGTTNTVLSDLYTLSYALLDNSLYPNRYSLEEYKMVIGVLPYDIESYVLVNWENADKPVTSGVTEWAKYEPLGQYSNEIQTNNHINQIYSSGNMSLYHKRK